MRCLLPLLLTAVLLAACAPPPTPFPVDIPTVPTATPAPGAAQAPAGLRYALGASASGAPIVAQADAQALPVELLDGTPDPAQLGIRYDIAADYGLFAGATAAPGITTVSLVMNTALEPLDDPALVDVIRGALDPAAALAALDLPGAQLSAGAPAAPLTAAALRAQMANAGWPDGFNLAAAAAPVPGVEALLAPLRALGIEPRPLQTTDITTDTWAENRLHMALIAWHTPEARQRWTALAGAGSVIDLYSLPVGYIALPGLDLTFTLEGWPLPARP